jgi:hypothetical protein
MMQMRPATLFRHLDSVVLTPICINDFRQDASGAQSYVAELVKHRVPSAAASIHPLKDARRELYIALPDETNPALAEALYLQTWLDQLLGSRRVMSIGKNLADRLTCRHDRLLLQSLRVVGEMVNTRSNKEKLIHYATEPVILRLIPAMLDVTSGYQNWTVQELAGFYEKLQTISYSLHVSPDGTTLAMCEFVSRLYTDIADAYNLWNETVPLDYGCECLPLCVDRDAQLLTVDGHTVNFEQPTLN